MAATLHHDILKCTFMIEHGISLKISPKFVLQAQTCNESTFLGKGFDVIFWRRTDNKAMVIYVAIPDE